MRAVASLLAFAASALAISVTAPTNATGWSTSGDNVVSWNAVSTDPSNVTIVLVNQAQFPPYQQPLAALVDTSLGTFKVSPPSSGWPTGKGFQVNLVRDSQNLNTILAQSDQFTLSASTSSSSSSTGGLSQTALTVSNTNPAGAAQTTAPGSSSNGNGNTNSDGTTSTDPANNPNPTSNNNGAVASGVQAGLFGFVALVGALLA